MIFLSDKVQDFSFLFRLALDVVNQINLEEISGFHGGLKLKRRHTGNPHFMLKDFKLKD